MYFMLGAKICLSPYGMVKGDFCVILNDFIT
jgi:hypothetical protein